jgi:hypothetical protein
VDLRWIERRAVANVCAIADNAHVRNLAANMLLLYHRAVVFVAKTFLFPPAQHPNAQLHKYYSARSVHEHAWPGAIVCHVGTPLVHIDKIC